MLDLDYRPESVINLKPLLENQKEKLRRLRERVKKLELVPIEPRSSFPYDYNN